MTKKTRTKRHEMRLQAMLRLGDPAGEGGPHSVEIVRTRAAILAAAAAPEPARLSWVPLPALGATGLVAVAVLAVAAWIGRSGPAAVLPAGPSVSTAAWSPVLPPDPYPDPEPIEAVFEAPSEAGVTPVPTATTVRFTTRRGTQIIWTLDPRIEL
jgi:hypothetical protein